MGQIDEIYKTEKSIMSRSKEVYLLRNSLGEPILVLGLIQTSMISGWHVWAMVCECDLKRYARSLRTMLRMLAKQLGHLSITVEKSFPQGVRFAKFLGFSLTSEVDSIDNKTYCFFDMDRAWLTQ